MSQSRPKLVLAFLAVYVIWGSTYLGIRFAIETLPPFLMAGVRFLLAGVILYGWARRRGAPRPARVHWKVAAVLAVLLLIGGNGGVVWAEQRVPSGLAALLIATEPFWIVMLDWLRPGGSRPGLAVVVGLLLGFVGVALLVSPFDLAGGGAVDPLGAAVVILASLSWAVGSLWTARGAPLPKSPMLTTGMEMLIGGALFMVIGTAAGEWSGVSLSSMSLKSVLALLYLVFFGAIVAFTAYVYLLQHTTPSKASTYAYVNPVIAVLLGWAFAGEELSGRVALAALAIVSAVVMITRFHAAPKAVAPDRSGTPERDQTEGVERSGAVPPRAVVRDRS
jgi:drug/metabolite transporter (DMT)-like permease